MNFLPENKNEQGHMDNHKTCTPSEEGGGAPEPVCDPQGRTGARPCRLVLKAVTSPPEDHRGTTRSNRYSP